MTDFPISPKSDKRLYPDGDDTTAKMGAGSRRDSSRGHSLDKEKTKLLFDEEGIPKPMFQKLSEKKMDEIALKGTDGKNDKVYKVVSDLIPPDLRPGLSSDFTDDEKHEIYHRIDIHAAETDHVKPKALWIFGPPAVGKTTICNEKAVEIFGRHHNSVIVDGAIFRYVHKGFQMVAQHGLRNDLLHADAWKLLKGSGCMDRLKEEVVELAIERRQHLRIPETAASMDRVNRMLKQLVDAGYELHALCLWAPKSETEARGRTRGVKDGKAFTTKEYDKACRNSLLLGQHWLDKIQAKDAHFKSVQFYDNTVFPSVPVHFSEYQRFVAYSHEHADRHAACSKESRYAVMKSELVSSEARAQGRSRLSAVRAGLAAWRSHWTEDTPLVSHAVLDWSLRHPEQVTEMAHGERRRGHIEGFLLGICATSAALAAAKLYQSRR